MEGEWLKRGENKKRKPLILKPYVQGLESF